MPDLSPLAAAIITLGSVCGVIAAGYKLVLPKWRKARVKWVAAQDAILGREAQYDSITGEETSPALPGIGLRITHQERVVEQLSVAVTKLVDQQVHQQRLEQRVDVIEGRVDDLEKARVERVVSKAESIAAWKAIEAATHATPDAEGDVEDPVED